ncbi:hypothetical protein D3C87_1048600 [compost metagenome]
MSTRNIDYFAPADLGVTNTDIVITKKSNMTNLFAWFLGSALIAYLIFILIKPKFVLKKNDNIYINEVDQMKAILYAILVAIVIVLIVYLVTK